jgi:hypothetical protein
MGYLNETVPDNQTRNYLTVRRTYDRGVSLPFWHLVAAHC